MLEGPFNRWSLLNINRHSCCPMILCVLVMLDVQSGGCWPWGYPDPPPPPPDKVVCDTWDSDCDCLSNVTEIIAANYPRWFNPNIPNSDPSDASGTPCGANPVTPETPAVGTLIDGINLADSGTGYYHFVGTELPYDKDDWGTGELVWVIEGAGRSFAAKHPNIAFGVLDMSKEYGGVFCWYDTEISDYVCHQCHQNGRDVDLRYIRTDGQQLPLNVATQSAYYDKNKTVDLINSFVEAGHSDCGSKVVLIYVGLSSDIPTGNYADYRIEQIQGHNNHMHIQIMDPD